MIASYIDDVKNNQNLLDNLFSTLFERCLHKFLLFLWVIIGILVGHLIFSLSKRLRGNLILFLTLIPLENNFDLKLFMVNLFLLLWFFFLAGWRFD